MKRTVSKAHRLKQLEEALINRELSVKELCERFGFERRTIQRDLDDLRTEHDIEQVGIKYRIKKKRTELNLNSVEALAVHSGTRLLAHHAHINERHYRSALEKLARQLPEPARKSLQKSADMLATKTSNNSRNLDNVARAWFEGRVLSFTYPAFDGNEYRREIEVYFLEISRTNLAAYVIGYERSYTKGIRIYKLDRMRNVRLLQDTYQVPPDFDPLDYLSTAWGIVVGDPVNVKLRFHPKVKQHVLEMPSDNLVVDEEQPDGYLLVTATAGRPNGGQPYELLAWIRSWGAMVEVLDPPDIRELIRQELQRALKLYEQADVDQALIQAV